MKRLLMILFAMAVIACQTTPAFGPGQHSLCPSGEHFVVDSLGFHNVCVKNGS